MDTGHYNMMFCFVCAAHARSAGDFAGRHRDAHPAVPAGRPARLGPDRPPVLAKVFNVAYKFVGRHDEAEDLTQDIFLKIFKSLDTFDRRANFQTWLISVSRNLCIDHYRSVRKERETIDRGVDASELSPASPGDGPIAALEQRDRVDAAAPGARRRCPRRCGRP